MKTYKITIQAVIRKTYAIEAEDMNSAADAANECFNVNNEPGVDEHYSQDILEICESSDSEEEVLP